MKVEGLPIEYLDQVPKRERPTYKLARSEIKADMTGRKLWMKYPFIVHGKFMYLVVSHDKLTKFTKV